MTELFSSVGRRGYRLRAPSILGAAALVGGLAFWGRPVDAQPAAGGVQVEPVVVRAIAHFDFDRSALLPADQAAMLAEVGKMQGVSWQRIVATGHTDDVGDAAYNVGLSQRRAQAVKAYLVSQGLADAMVDAQGAGESKPVADNQDAAGRARNRRAEVEFQGVRTVAR